MYAWLDSDEGVHMSLLRVPRSWTRAPPVPHGTKAREGDGTGGARVHERGTHSGLLWTSPPRSESSQPYMGPFT